jgi:hypothetical protein
MEQLLDGQIRIERGGAAAPEQRRDREYTLCMTAMKGRIEGMDGSHPVENTPQAPRC